jgi:hypothetical protein
MESNNLNRNNPNTLIFIILSITIFSSCNQSKSIQIGFKNPNPVEMNDQVIVVSRNIFEKSTKTDLEDFFPVPASRFQTLPVQYDDLDGDGKWDELAFKTSFNPEEKKSIEFSFEKKESQNEDFESSTNVHFGVKPAENKPAQPVDYYVLIGNDLPWHDEYYPFQMDGPAWENEKVGFRLYFDGRNPKDVFAKRQPDLVLENVGLDSLGNPVDNYHVLEDWGRDVLQVGNSLGAGGLAMLKNDSLHRLGIIRGAAQDVVDSTVFELSNSGPVRGIFSLTYYGWQVGNEKIDVKEIISINSGEFCYHSRVIPFGSDKKTTLVTGMANLNNDNPLQVIETDSELTLLTHDKQTYEKEYFMGMALSAEKRNGTGYNQATASGPGVVSSYYISQPLHPNQEWEYTFYACCELADPKFKNPEYFKNYIQKELDKKDIEIQLKKQ